MLIGGYPFEYICEILPVKDAFGLIKEFMPQSRYSNSNNLSLNKYGRGPFCGFKIPNHYRQCGVYGLVSDMSVMYIGECVDLSLRYNMGYGIISPRNCFVGGQETNCRVNNLIFEYTQYGKQLSLWFYPTSRHKEIERRLLASIKTQWNR